MFIAVFFIRIFTGSKFAFIGQMADTPIAIETLVQRFGSSVCSTLILFYQEKNNLSFLSVLENELGTDSKKGSKKAIAYAYYITGTYDPPNIIICSVAEMEATTPSMELQAYKNMGVSNYYCYFMMFLF